MGAYRWISRAEWGANPLNVQVGHATPHEQYDGLVVHHTVIVMPDYDHDGLVGGDIDDICSYMRQLQRARPDLGLEVPYSFVIFEGSTPDEVIVAEGRGFGRTGAHTIGYNSTRYGCALAGDYTAREPTPGQIAGIRWVGAQLADPSGAVSTLGHRDVYATACPGVDAYPHLDEMQPPFTAPPAPTEEDDMPPAPATLVLSGGNIVSVVRGADHETLFYSSAPGAFSPLPGKWSSGASAVLSGPNIVVRGAGTDGTLLQTTLEYAKAGAQWTTPQPLGGKLG